MQKPVTHSMLFFKCVFVYLDRQTRTRKSCCSFISFDAGKTWRSNWTWTMCSFNAWLSWIQQYTVQWKAATLTNLNQGNLRNQTRYEIKLNFVPWSPGGPNSPLIPAGPRFPGRPGNPGGPGSGLNLGKFGSPFRPVAMFKELLGN